MEKEDQIRDAIDTSPWFYELPPEGKAYLSQHARLINARKGEVLCTCGEVSDCIIGVVSGGIRTTRVSPEGYELTIGDLIPGEWMGDYMFRDTPKWPCNAVAANRSILVKISHDAFNTAANRWPILYKSLYRSMQEHTYGLLKVLEQVCTKPLSVRTAEVLEILYNMDNSVYPKQGVNKIKMTQAELAGLCHSSRQHINRLLRQWSSEGLIHTHGGWIECVNFERLHAKRSLGTSNP